MEIRERIQERLDELGMSARAASLKAKLSTHFLQKYLANPDHSIKVENLRALAGALETSPEWLLSGVGEQAVKQETAEIIDIWERKLSQEDRQAVLDFAKWRASNDGN